MRRGCGPRQKAADAKRVPLAATGRRSSSSSSSGRIARERERAQSAHKVRQDSLLHRQRSKPLCYSVSENNVRIHPSQLLVTGYKLREYLGNNV